MFQSWKLSFYPDLTRFVLFPGTKVEVRTHPENSRSQLSAIRRGNNPTGRTKLCYLPRRSLFDWNCRSSGHPLHLNHIWTRALLAIYSLKWGTSVQNTPFFRPWWRHCWWFPRKARTTSSENQIFSVVFCSLVLDDSARSCNSHFYRSDDLDQCQPTRKKCQVTSGNSWVDTHMWRQRLSRRKPWNCDKC